MGNENNTLRSFAHNLSRLMKEHDLTQEEISVITGVSQQSVSNWIGEVNMPRMGVIETLAQRFNVPKSSLLEDSSTSYKTIGVKIPVLGHVQAGIPVEAIENIVHYEEITQELAKTGEFFGLVIKGDSMYPRMQDGDVVIVKKQDYIDNGNTAIVLVNGLDATVKRVLINEAGLTLIANNPTYDPQFFSGQEVSDLPVCIIGKVIELRVKF